MSTEIEEQEAQWAHDFIEIRRACRARASQQRLIESARNGQRLLPGIDEEAPQDVPESTLDQEQGKDAPDTSDEAWRNVTMESIGVKGRLLERLVEAGVSNLGQWSDWHGQGSNRVKIAGIGENAMGRVADLCEAFWSEAQQAAM